uniref:Uncharacterized protein n=1 Tax=Micrurus lemniscatus lemniscatus TaxID=129467 RepID=A0A2D4JCF4_MICLE
MCLLFQNLTVGQPGKQSNKRPDLQKILMKIRYSKQRLVPSGYICLATYTCFSSFVHVVFAYKYGSSLLYNMLVCCYIWITNTCGLVEYSLAAILNLEGNIFTCFNMN